MYDFSRCEVASSVQVRVAAQSLDFEWYIDRCDSWSEIDMLRPKMLPTQWPRDLAFTVGLQTTRRKQGSKGF